MAPVPPLKSAYRNRGHPGTILSGIETSRRYVP